MNGSHCVILGGASCVWDDVTALEEIYGKEWDGLVIAANDIGAHWPRRLDHWVTLHAYKLGRWAELRKRYGFPDGYVTWGRDNAVPEPRRTDSVLVPWGGACSGLFAVQVAEELGCVRTVLCGIPMTVTPHFAETTERFAAEWHGAGGYWAAWQRHRDLMPCVRSMSGRTQELLGAPQKEWLRA